MHRELFLASLSVQSHHRPQSSQRASELRQTAHSSGAFSVDPRLKQKNTQSTIGLQRTRTCTRD